MSYNLYRQIPKTDELLAMASIRELIENHSHNLVLDAIRTVLETVREGIKNGVIMEINAGIIEKMVADTVDKMTTPSLRTVVNGTGVILHTNLGRALLSKEAIDAVVDVATNYNTLEYDPEEGKRGSRYTHIEAQICKLCNCEAAMVVNNNAAAVMLILGAITRGKEVPVSRGELVEIGGSFRVPEIMEQSGTILKEVGATNKTHPRDYENAINENTGALLKVHTSNFKIMGFTESVGLAEMAEIAHSHNIPLIYDLGGGSFADLAVLGIEGEPTVFECAKTGADIISFSGDKLFGGPQAGIIIGKKEYIEKMKKHPLTRAFRCDKMTIAALCATLNAYHDMDQAKKDIPTLNMIFMSNEEMLKKAQTLQKKLKTIKGLDVQVVSELAQVGGGSVPSQMLQTKCVSLKAENMKTSELEEKLRHLKRPIVTRVARDRVLFCMRTTKKEDFGYIYEALKAVLGE